MKLSTILSLAVLLGACASDLVENQPVPPGPPPILPPRERPQTAPAPDVDGPERNGFHGFAFPAEPAPEPVAPSQDTAQARQPAGQQPSQHATTTVTYYPSNYYPPYSQTASQRPVSTFPIGTILGGTIGGIIGNQSNKTECGIAIGAGVGVLLDSIPWGRW